MRIRNLSWLAASLTLDFALFAFPVAVHADTYQFFGIGDAASHQGHLCSGFGECIVHGDTYQFFGVGDLQIERFYGLATDGTVVLLAEFGYETGAADAAQPDVRQRNTLHTYGPAAGNDGWGGNLRQRARSVPNQHGWPVHRSGRGE